MYELYVGCPKKIETLFNSSPVGDKWAIYLAKMFKIILKKTTLINISSH